MLPLALIFLLSQEIISSFSLPTSSDSSILEMMNIKEIERFLNEKRQNRSREQKLYLLENELDENFPAPEQEYEIQRLKLLDDEHQSRTENPRVDLNLFLKRNNQSDSYRTTELLQDLRGYNGRKLLKSSKNALFVTKKEYLHKDWCKTEPLIQKVKEEGCLTRTVINRFCYGQCNSFYIPKNPKKRHRYSEEREDEDQNGPAFRACSFCRPSKFTWITITLKCPSMLPPYRKKRIQRIKQCKCMPANVN